MTTTREIALEAALQAFLRAPSIGSSGPGSVTIEVQTFNLKAARAALALPSAPTDGATIKPKPSEEVYIHSMGKRLRLTAIATTDDAANAHMGKPSNEDAVIACFGPLVLMANKHDNGTR